MSVRYKFKDEKRWKTIAFDSAVISVLDLKRAIVQQLKELNPDEDTNTNMIFTNAQTGERYVAENFLIPKNTAVDVRKVPGSAEVIGRIHEPPVVTILSQNRSAPVTTTNPDTSAAADDEMRRLEEVLNQSSYATGARHNRPGLLADLASAFEAPAPALAASIAGPGHPRRPQFARTGRPRPGYICHRCQMPGHFIQDCPTNGNTEYNFQRPKPGTGIPLSMLKPVEAGQGAYRLEDGTYANIEPNHRAFNEAFSAHDRAEQKIAMEKAMASTEDFTCQICKKLYDDPTVTNCCYTTFCRACIVSNLNCPICQEAITDIDELNRNTALAQRVEEFMKTQDLTRTLTPTQSTLSSQLSKTQLQEQQEQEHQEQQAQQQPQQRAPIPIYQSTPRYNPRRQHQQQASSLSSSKDEPVVRPVEVKQRHIIEESQPQVVYNNRPYADERKSFQDLEKRRIEDEQRMENERRRQEDLRREEERRRDEERCHEEERRRQEDKHREEERRRAEDRRREEDRRRKEDELRQYQAREAERRRYHEHRMLEERRRDEERRRLDERRYELDRRRSEEDRRRQLDARRPYPAVRHRDHREITRHERVRSRSPLARRRALARSRR